MGDLTVIRDGDGDGDTHRLEEDTVSSEVTLPAADQAAFKARLKQFEYSPKTDISPQRRSSRFATWRSSTPCSPVSSASPSRKRRRLSSQPRTDGDESKERDEELARGSAGSKDSTLTPKSKSKKKRSTTKERSARDPYSPTNKLVDSLRPGLILVFVGLNPGLMTAATGHAYAHPSNRFWHIVHASGITPQKHDPSETRDLMDLYQIGNTNICARPTRSGDGLSKAELEEGALILDQKIAQCQPEAVAIVGKGIWEAIWMVKKGQKKFKDPDFHWGWQDEEMQLGRRVDESGRVIWAGAKTFVATSTSGLAATLTPAEKLAIWKPLGDWVTRRREEWRAEVLQQ
ncbi:TDG/mug DNA glycosylase [Capronia epimyces CBS 606.96]|uniref:TDG/mug DNA glycosylase n=1 Tax=Capronia epimyces CBS 606.96 TaxID=1182542 RepID=W9YK51_9EURO|nr:TDG/mug DNA glycosylase [Capronia epimyces CBS 606.96]EXJ90060.1 TDG/mug DNA glycosylase [Capronia epimyces CBS 606.96]